MHRRENQPLMNMWFQELNNIAKQHPTLSFFLPLHPNPEVQKCRHILTHVQVADPLSHDQFIEMLAQAHLVITDSGGIQEEAAFLKKFCIVCREQTGRQEGLGHFATLCPKPILLMQTFQKHINSKPRKACPYGDGHAGKRAEKILMNYLESKQI